MTRQPTLIHRNRYQMQLFCKCFEGEMEKSLEAKDPEKSSEAKDPEKSLETKGPEKSLEAKDPEKS